MSKCGCPWRVPVKHDLSHVAYEPTSVNAFMPVREVRCERESGYAGDHRFTEVYTFKNVRPVRCTYLEYDPSTGTIATRCCLEMGHDGQHNYVPMPDKED